MRIYFILPLVIFSIIGFAITYFAIKQHWEVGFFGWLTISLFTLFPLIVLYGILFGFSLSAKQQWKMEERQNKLFADERGITIEMPLFDKQCFIDWQSIETVIYYNYVVSSDFIEFHHGFKFYVNSLPTYITYDRRWWLNRLFDKESKSKIIKVTSETRGYQEIPGMIKKYLDSEATIDYCKDPQSRALKQGDKEEESIVYSKSKIK